MYTVIRRYTGTGLREVIKNNEASLRKTMMSVPGFHGYYLLEGNDVAASVTICDTKACMTESTKRAGEWIKDHVPSSVKLSKPDVTEGEVILEIGAKMPVA